MAILTVTKQTHITRILSDQRWQALAKRDLSADGKFVFSIKTTGVYCRPSCSARLPRPENVDFYRSCAEAERAGFRPCKRCKPQQPPLKERNAAKIAEVCRLIESSESVLTLDELAAIVQISPYHLHRLFKENTGVTPKAYFAAEQTKRMRTQLNTGESVTGAIFDAGFNSASRFYEKSTRVLGMTPTEYRNGGGNAAIQFAVGECSLGSILVASSAKGVCAILLGEDPEALVEDLQNRFPNSVLTGGDKIFEEHIAQVIGFIDAPALGLSLPLDIRGTAFQQRVWQELQKIPVGQTLSYSDVAQRIGLPKAIRAVAAACAANNIAVAIPCHRVVRRDGALSGYRWGIERKRCILEREAKA